MYDGSPLVHYFFAGQLLRKLRIYILSEMTKQKAPQGFK